MTIGQEFWKEVESGMKASRRLVERGPDDKVQWKPHPKSAALGHLTQLVCRMPKLMSDIVKGIDLDLAAGPGHSFEATEALLRDFDANVAEVGATLTRAKDADVEGAWNVCAGKEIYDTAGRKDAPSAHPRSGTASRSREVRRGQ